MSGVAKGTLLPKLMYECSGYPIEENQSRCNLDCHYLCLNKKAVEIEVLAPPVVMAIAIYQNVGHADLLTVGGEMVRV
jgi:hypothetical protein